MPTVSVIVCTYGRAEALIEVFRSLEAQATRDFEVLLVDGNGANSPVERLATEYANRIPLRWVRSGRGLTRQRNVGLRLATGQILCFLDDDVAFEPGFLTQTMDILASPGMSRVGGITGYDVLNYPSQVSVRWKLRRALGTIPSLNPGEVDRLGRAVPVSFLAPFSGYREIGWLAGFCMIYRREAVQGLEFDEQLPTYGGEDRDFSMRVGKSWKLMIAGDLKISHLGTPQGRDSDVERMRQTGFGTGRRFAQTAQSLYDHGCVLQTLVGDLLVDTVKFVCLPTRENFRLIFARLSGSFAGYQSWHHTTERAK